MGGGGYVAGPVGLAARTLGLPLVLTEADSHLGVANRLLARLADRVFLAFPIAGREGERYEVAGRPLPAGTGEADRGQARERLGIGADEACLLVFGGSLGARRINDAAMEAFGSGAPGAVLHACGPPRPRRAAAAPGGAGIAAALPPARLHLALRRRPRGGRPGGGPLGRLGARGGGRRAAVDPRALPARHGRPPDPQRPPHGARGRRGGGARRRAGRPAAGARGGRAAGRARPDAGDGERRARGGKPDAARRIADELLRLAGT